MWLGHCRAEGLLGGLHDLDRGRGGDDRVARACHDQELTGRPERRARRREQGAPGALAAELEARTSWIADPPRQGRARDEAPVGVAWRRAHAALVPRGDRDR